MITYESKVANKLKHSKPKKYITTYANKYTKRNFMNHLIKSYTKN